MPTVTRPREAGAVLAICLVFLLMLTLLAVAGSQAAINQQRMAGNYLSQQGLLLAAENVLMALEQDLLTGEMALPEFPCPESDCDLPVTDNPLSAEQLSAAGWRPILSQSNADGISHWYRLSLLPPATLDQLDETPFQGRRYRLAVIALSALQHSHLETVYELQPR
ncbi:MAG: hypothetical protein CVV07_04335 [Gammaproteobacteria bacterium HGW-Gammaproteobacteria-11]|nr:MAG: hypothetical protein CVV07_04335 [Gammaproteobacteria bacterium HGW-Gammaproteobacteria-11]